jgi:hypothetical protein
MQQSHLEASSHLKINFEIFKILKKELPEVSDVHLVFNLLKTHENDLDGEALQELYAYVRNFSIMIIAVTWDNTEIISTLHELYVDNLNRGYLHYEGKLSPSRYFAVVDNALKVDQPWAIDFIEKYKDEIYGENESRDIYRYNKAHYLFAIGKYDECLDFIPATSNLLDYHLRGKRMELKALYELNSDLFSYKLDAFKMYLSRTSPKILSESQRIIHVAFTNVLAQIIAAPPGDTKRADRIIKRLEDDKSVAEWTWLLAKAKALKTK